VSWALLNPTGVEGADWDEVELLVLSSDPYLVCRLERLKTDSAYSFMRSRLSERLDNVGVIGPTKSIGFIQPFWYTKTAPKNTPTHPVLSRLTELC